MRRISWIFIALLAIAESAAAQSPAARPRFDAAASAGLIEASPGEMTTPYYDSWYAQGRYAGSIGYYLTKNLKAEFEHAWNGEGSRYYLDYTRINGMPYSFQVEQHFQLQQSTARIVWQYGDNAWVHPYIGAGVVLDTERQHDHLPVSFQPGPRGERLLVQYEMDRPTHTQLRTGVSLNGGAKIYVTQRAFINTAAIITYSRPAKTVNLIAGFGVDF